MVLCFFIFSQVVSWQLYISAAEILEIWIWTGSVSSGYIFYVLVTIVSFFLIVETREGMLVCLKKSASFVLFGFSFSVFFSFPWISKRWSSSYSSLIRLPNCLLTLPETTELYVIIAKHWPTVCQLDWRLTNCLPTSWHSEHQINSFHRVRSTEMVDYQNYCPIFGGFFIPTLSWCDFSQLYDKYFDEGFWTQVL